MIVENISQRAGKRVHVVQGEHYVTGDPEVTLTTILGSCVAVCLWDPERGVGGMNHFLLPEGCIDRGHSGQVFGDMVDTSGMQRRSSCLSRSVR